MSTYINKISCYSYFLKGPFAICSRFDL